MSAIRHGREQLPPDVARQQRRMVQSPPTYRCPYCPERGMTIPEQDAHIAAAHPGA